MTAISTRRSIECLNAPYLILFRKRVQLLVREASHVMLFGEKQCNANMWKFSPSISNLMLGIYHIEVFTVRNGFGGLPRRLGCVSLANIWMYNFGCQAHALQWWHTRTLFLADLDIGFFFTKLEWFGFGISVINYVSFWSLILCPFLVLRQLNLVFETVYLETSMRIRAWDAKL